MELETIELLRELAGKLGQTVDSLWPHAVRYVAISGVMDILVGVVLLLAAGFVYSRKIRDDREYDSTDETLFNTFRWAGTGVLSIIGLCGVYYGVLSIVEPIGTLVMKVIG